MRAALRRAVISVDPDAAERRRKDAERRAKVGLYGDEEGTATLSGQNLPGAHAAAAMARISALARAMKASGAPAAASTCFAPRSISACCSAPSRLIPPAEDAPPDNPGDRPPGRPGSGDSRDSGCAGDPGPEDACDPGIPGSEPGEPSDPSEPSEPSDHDEPSEPQRAPRALAAAVSPASPVSRPRAQRPRWAQ